MSARPIPRDARRSELWFDGLPQALRNAVEEYDFESSNEFSALADLSGATRFEGIDVDGDSAVVSDGNWSAPGTVYVVLVYDPNSNEPVQMTDSYPVTINFKVENQQVSIDNIEPDVRSFYE